MPTENILSMLILAEWESLLCPAMLVKNAVSFSMKTAYVDVHDNIVELLSCTMLSVSISRNRNNL